MNTSPSSVDENSKVLRRISRNVKELRLSKGLKQTDMAQFGFGYRWYQRLESGRHVPTLLTLLKLAKALNVDIAVLFK